MARRKKRRRVEARRRREANADIRKWRPLERVSQAALTAKYLQATQAGGVRPTEIWTNDRYECAVRPAVSSEPRYVHLSISRVDRRPVRDWRHLQQIKNEVCGELWTGLEFFPPEDRLTDSANQYHLFCFPPDINFDCFLGGAGHGLVSDDEAVARWNAAPHPGRQEPWEPGLTTGRTQHSAPARKRLTERQAESD